MQVCAELGQRQAAYVQLYSHPPKRQPCCLVLPAGTAGAFLSWCQWRSGRASGAACPGSWRGEHRRRKSSRRRRRRLQPRWQSPPRRQRRWRSRPQQRQRSRQRSQQRCRRGRPPGRAPASASMAPASASMAAGPRRRWRALTAAQAQVARSSTATQSQVLDRRPGKSRVMGTGMMRYRCLVTARPLACETVPSRLPPLCRPRPQAPASAPSAACSWASTAASCPTWTSARRRAATAASPSAACGAATRSRTCGGFQGVVPAGRLPTLKGAGRGREGSTPPGGEERSQRHAHPDHNTGPPERSIKACVTLLWKRLSCFPTCCTFSRLPPHLSFPLI